MSSQSGEMSPASNREDSKEAASNKLPEVLPALEGALETAGVDVRDPQVTKAVQVSTSFFIARGSLPIMPPEILAEYENEFPGLGQKIIGWTEQQRDHRQYLERIRAEGSEKRMTRGQLIAGGVAIWGITLAALVGIFGSVWAAGILAIVSIGGPTSAIWLASTMNGGSKPATQPQPPNAPSRPSRQS